MKWIVSGIKAVKRGHMNVNTAEAVKRCARYTREKTVWDL